MKSVLFCLIVLTTTSCAQKQDNKNSEKKSRVYFYHGNPEEFLVRTEAHNRSFINLKNYKNFDNYSWKQTSQLSSHSEVESFYSDEAHGFMGWMYQSQPYKFQVDSKKKEATYSNGVGLEFHFAIDENQDFNLTKICFDDECKDLNPAKVYYSYLPEYNYFSLNFPEVYGPLRKYVSAFFSIEKTFVAEKMSEKYHYIQGPGGVPRWDASKPLTISLCGLEKELQPIVIDSIKAWEKVLEGRLEIDYQILDSYPPFVDLRNHCIYSIENFQTVSIAEYGNYGITQTLIYGNIVDADIFILRRELEKFNSFSAYIDDPEFKPTLRKTMLHEVGHLLGLDHQFDGTLSVMSYEKTTVDIQAYDIEAIQALYPLKEPKLTSP